MTLDEFIDGFAQFRTDTTTRPHFQDLDDVALVDLYRLWLSLESHPATLKQKRTLYLCLKRVWLYHNEVGLVESLTQEEATRLIGIGFKRRDGGLGFKPAEASEGDAWIDEAVSRQVEIAASRREAVEIISRRQAAIEPAHSHDEPKGPRAGCMDSLGNLPRRQATCGGCGRIKDQLLSEGHGAGCKFDFDALEPNLDGPCPNTDNGTHDVDVDADSATKTCRACGASGPFRVFVRIGSKCPTCLDEPVDSCTTCRGTGLVCEEDEVSGD